MLIVIVVILFNIFGNYGLGFGKWGFFVLGIIGLVIVSISVYWIMFLFLLVYMFWYKFFY